MTFEGAIRKGGDWKVVVVALSRECPEPSVRERANNSGGAIEGRKKRGGWEGNKTQTRAVLSLLRTWAHNRASLFPSRAKSLCGAGPDRGYI